MREIVRDEESAPFFDATARGELVTRRCSACGHYLRPVALACPACHSRDLSWAAVSGDATLVSWIVTPAAPGADATGAEAVVTGLVELAEGPWLHARIDGADPATLVVGDRLVVTFLPAGAEQVPAFRLAPA